MEYETVRFISWTGFRITVILAVHYLFTMLDLFLGCLAMILIIPSAVVLYYHIPTPPKTTVQKIFNRLDKFMVGAHRAACLDAPENSLAALYKCNERGCQLIEFDLSFTSDDQAVVFHDNTVDRISDGSGSISALTWNELKQLDINAKHPKKADFPATRVALLSEMVEECLRLDLLFIIDIKAPDARAPGAVLALYEKFPKMYEMAMVSSFYPQVIYEIRRRDQQVVACMAWRPHFCAYGDYSPQEGPTQRRYQNPLKHVAASALDIVLAGWAMSLLPYLCGLSVLLLHKDSVTSASVRRAHELDLRLIAWTVNDPVQKAYMARYLKVAYLTDTLSDDQQLAADA
ncbi:glycerophosphodiester phosphodiesterase 1-like [Pollicipes pollicipes]|uniref:glycerophosphodiester phosphodiesterase 1-like n=1 Tax=Pollicipes pollicipes TaxID=41117 RepID=UPI001884FDFA|nr:glycerophosphodiester phosphodiesterase 1-like [Pollicipes pollicipes]XP_037074206.1 glycerophosphodiester phosphodiesterase 1-like [Pollicipes pollicipes]XP_037074207.1 glycerophosphodiester phosphodiesterase 1-like [Pollicipes pollicipes]